jgi:hypothetical protein
MSRLRVGVIRYASVANQIAASLGVDPSPEVTLGARIKILFRSIGASRWPESQQVEFALQVADVARRVLSTDARRGVRKRASSSAIVVSFEDATLLRGCAVVSRWEAVVPATGDGES